MQSLIYWILLDLMSSKTSFNIVTEIDKILVQSTLSSVEQHL